MSEEKKQATRIQTSILNPYEKKALVYMAERMPSWVNSDMLTFVGFLGALVMATGYALSNLNLHWLWLSCLGLLINWFGGETVDFIDGPYWAKMMVLCIYVIWIVMPFKILILTSALASVDQNYYNAAKVDGTRSWRIFWRITLPMISPTVFYLIITGFIGAFKEYSDAVALFGTDLNSAGMNTIVGYIYDMLYGNSGGYPSYASAAAIILFAIVLSITCINLLVSKKHVHY